MFFIPYSPEVVLLHFSTKYALDLTTLTDYETLIVTIFANLYFVIFWFFIVAGTLKMFNRIFRRFI